MCGIVGYVGSRKILPVLLQGLGRLEYRGYDSAGVACLDRGSAKLFIAKEKGKLDQLRSVLNGKSVNASLGIAHTRWATHGAPSKTNAHPHTDQEKRIAVVHNGIVENSSELRHFLKQRGHQLKSETDTEVIPHLIAEFNHGDLEVAFRRTVEKLRGFFAIVMISSDEPDKLFVFKRSNPLILGVGKNENFAASDVTAVLPYTRKVVYLQDNEFAVLSRDSVKIYPWKKKTAIVRKPTEIRWTIDKAKKDGYAHFMLKEIFEQSRVARETLEKRLKKGRIVFDTLGSKADAKLRKIKKIFFVSCGTAYHAGLVGRYMCEEYARVRTEAQISSEFRYSNAIVGKDDLVVLVTQSGETADTLAAFHEAKAKGAMTLAIVNVVGSTIAREADHVLYTHAGPEIGVASTKAYIAQLLTIAFFSIYLGSLRRTITASLLGKLTRELSRIPGAIAEILKTEKSLNPAVKALYKKKNFLFIGRGYNFPTALEGALKLKEVSYAHAHGYAGGEMKHGPIALIDRTQPVICLAPHARTYDKMLSNIQEIRARDAIVLTIATKGDLHVKGLSNWVFYIPKTFEIFSTILSVVPLQLFAYKIAVKNKRDVDQPRNLAKSVTVE